VVFSFALAGLIQGRVDAAWARWVRPWTLFAWSLLTVGITLGSYWAYYELGWGGWWFWDPVENASFMPWLAGTALLHSAIVTEKRGALAGWTSFLAIAGFGFSMLGAFLVRSGVLTSVHAFAVDPTRGVLLLSIFLVAAGAGFGLFAWRAPKLSDTGLFAPVSRESALVLNNLFLSAAVMVVLLGTLYPLIREALTGEPISVGPPFFNLTFAPVMALCLLLLPVGPMLSWKRADILGALQRLWAAGLIAVAAGLAVFLIKRPASAFSAAGFALGAWLVTGALVEAGERMRLGRAPLGEVRRRLAALPRGAWGMTLAHLGLGLFILGACFESAWKVETAQSLAIGGQARLGAYQLSLDDVRNADGPNYAAQRASVTVTRAGRRVCAAGPERRLYYAGGQATSEVAICQKGLDDLYLVLGEQRPGPGAPQWVVRAFYNPLARLIFFGPIIMALGGLISQSDRRLRFALPRRAAAPSPALEPAE
jgi:cytochrome c-type biogenesis protein CcmF